MHTFSIVTLVDIGNPGNVKLPFPFTSKTGVLVDDKETLETVRLQKSNFTTLQQLIQLRANVEWKNEPAKHQVNLKDMEFGSFYREGKHSVWIFAWQIEQTEVYAENGNPVGGLTADFNLIPTHSFLQETVTFPSNCFNTQDPKFKNTYFIDLGPVDK
jgi:hypothetical protein